MVEGKKNFNFRQCEKEAIVAWKELLEAAKFNHKVFKTKNTLWWVLESLGRLSNDYIAISEVAIGGAFQLLII